MKVISFMRQGFELVPVEVELSLTAGLPQIIFMGLPDTIIRESVVRIKSALRYQNFEFPAARQVLVHLRPTHIKKTSRGLDLAVAAALLWETEQVPLPDPSAGPPIVYGELSLKGEVLRPDDLEDLLPDQAPSGVWTGEGKELPFPLLCVRELRDIVQPTLRDAKPEAFELIAPPVPDLRLHEEAADVLAAAVTGEHHTLLAGPPGSGKTTAVEVMPCLFEPPDSKTYFEARRVHRALNTPLTWRPVIQPHHSVTSLAMVGGGAPPWPGEITRAHGGLLFMDEFLEFNPAVQEALREPLESGQIRISRGEFSSRFPARFLLMGTTNLCPCGRYLPGRDDRCRCPRARRAAYVSRLKGPFVDRFAMLAYTTGWADDLQIPIGDIKERVADAMMFRRRTRGQEMPNGRLSDGPILKALTPFQRDKLLPKVLRSRRRYLSMLRVARTFADLDRSESIENRHLEKAIGWTVRSFADLERADG